MIEFSTSPFFVYTLYCCTLLENREEEGYYVSRDIEIIEVFSVSTSEFPLI